MIEGTAKIMYQKLPSFFITKTIPYKTNLTGFASDDASVMVSKYNSGSFKTKKRLLYLFTMTCICQSMHLCGSNACLKLPRGIEGFARNVYNFFLNSPKRTEHFKKFQVFSETKIYKILHFAPRQDGFR